MRLSLAEHPTRRVFAIAIVCSILVHILLLGSLLWFDTLGPPLYAKRGEPLFVDIAPDKPEEKAPLGNPARPPAPAVPEPPPRAAEPPTPRPKIAAAPPPSARKAPPPRPAPEPPKEVVKAPQPAPEPPAQVPTPPPPALEPPAPAPEPQASGQQAPPAAPREVEPPETAKSPEASPGPVPSGSEGSGAQTALAKPPSEPPPSIFRYPGGGGGLRGGRGGAAGEPIPLDTPDPNYREYMEKVKQRIYSKWGYPYDAQTRGLQGKLVIEFHISKDGRLQFIELRQSSGEEILDSFAMTAVKLAQVYPPLPDAMRRDMLPIVAIFVYTLRGPLSVLQSLQ